MKKSLISLAILAASGAASAQSNVTIYGIMDAGIVSEHGGKNGNVTKVGSGINSASRIGFKGTEDLGGGLSAVFTLETGIKEDTGELDNTSNRLFNRQAFVGLSSKTAGTLTLGRQYTPWYNTFVQVGDPFQAGLEGSAKNIFPANGINVRNDNSIVYRSPEFYGVSGELFYAMGEKAHASTGRQLGASIGYQNGPLNVRVAYNNINNDTAVGSVVTEKQIGHNTLIAANYDFKVVKAYAMFGSNKGLNSANLTSASLPGATTGLPAGLPAGSSFSAYNGSVVSPSLDSRTWLVGANVPVSAAGSIIVSYAKVDDKTYDQDAHQAAIGYTHSLSKRTNLYLSYAKINNKNGASYIVGNNSDVGTGDSAYSVGIRHAF
ncbi:porin [Pseudoduganella eburnea]|uniref:Porin n=1 Tax=Massilia eburnea TaxID=1776165 RepID=A0A6L6QJL5_9BURK|nr:porin [Massilia eburnea]MTW12469.1 porin [Massilia eburnea]